MISDYRLEAIVRNALLDGKNATQVSRETGIPAERVQRMMHRLNGRDPDAASRTTRKRNGKRAAQMWGTTLAGPQHGPNRRRGRPRG